MTETFCISALHNFICSYAYVIFPMSSTVTLENSEFFSGTILNSLNVFFKRNVNYVKNVN